MVPDLPRNRRNTDSQLELLVTAEQARLLFRSMPAGIGGALFGVAILAILLWGSQPAGLIIVWTLLVAAALCGVLVVHAGYVRARPDAEGAIAWAERVVWPSSLAGLGWGLAAFFFFPAPIEIEALTTMMICIVVFGTLVHLGSYPRTYRNFLVLATAPFIIRFLTFGDRIHLALAAGGTSVLAVAAAFAAAHNRLTRDGLRLGFENQAISRDLEHRKAEAERANLAKTRFLAAASHDLRQPMHAMGMLVELLRAKQMSAEQSGIVDSLRKSVSAMDELFDALLDVSKLDAGGVQPAHSAFPIMPLLSAIRDEFTPTAAARGVQLRLAPCSLAVRSDAILLERILRNLVSNAVRYTHSGKILVGCRRRPLAIAVQVLDTGQGIPAGQIDAVFEEFYQLNNPERDRGKGLGLGLSIVDRLARLLAHPLRVSSRPGCGTLFEIEVPRGRLDESATPDGGDVIAPFDGRLVVLIDDDAEVRDAAEKLMASWGCAVVAAGSVEELRLRLSAEPRAPDLIVADYRLRENATGVEAIALLREEFNTVVPGLLVTGDTSPERLREAAASGLPLLHKPVKTEVLRAAIGRALRAIPGQRDEDARRRDAT